METCGNNSLLTSKLYDSDDTTADVLFGFDDLPFSSAGSESDDDVFSTSEAVDPNSRVILDKLSNPRVDVADTINLDLPETTCEKPHSEASTAAKVLSECGRSDSEEFVLAGDSSEIFNFLSRRPGLLGYYDFCMTKIWRFRQKGYLLPFQLIWLAFTIACGFMGVSYWFKCPANQYIPRYVFINGAVATISWCIEIMDSFYRLLVRRRSRMLVYFCSFGFCWVAIITTLIEMIQFYTMSYSFHKNEENYCNETFYWFVYYKNIAVGVLMFMTAWIYLDSFVCYCWEDEYDSDSDSDDDDYSFHSENL